jgi:hypothetical protein
MNGLREASKMKRQRMKLTIGLGLGVTVVATALIILGAPFRNTYAMKSCAALLTGSQRADDFGKFEKCYRSHGGTGQLVTYEVTRSN